MMQRTTKNESWKPAWKSWRGSHSKMMSAAAKSELTRSLGRRKTQPIMTTVSMTVARMAEAGQPVRAT